MADYYKAHHRYYVAVDCIILGLNNGRLSLLLARRAFPPEQGKWSLMGGFVHPSESVDQAARRVLVQLTGLADVDMTQVGAFGAVNRDPGDRVVSVAYYALINFDEHDRRKVLVHNARWFETNQLPDLCFDHPEMLDAAMKLIRRRLQTDPGVLRLLPAQFTLSQMQALYETLGGRQLDKRNFRKRVAETPCIEATGEIAHFNSKRGARLYRYNPEIYDRDRRYRIL